MTLIVKFMSAENSLNDDDKVKSFRLVTGVADISFHRNDGVPVYDMTRPPHVPYGDAITEHGDVQGDVYVMNEAGKTIASFSPNIGR
jgi:hypothetical protein